MEKERDKKARGKEEKEENKKQTLGKVSLLAQESHFPQTALSAGRGQNCQN